ncbi:MAG: HEPN domain-containing protein [Deltaproteobacteria bacterium]|nr:MAG: HEPN domain-containing protein [Deltaproteobacteria bacterium]
MLVRAGHPRRQTPSIACAARGTSRGWHARVRTMSSQPPSDVLRELARRYTDLLRSHLSERLVSVVLFGSVARGDASPASDIDLLIVAEDLPQGQFARKRLLATADEAFEPELERAEAAGVESRLARIVRTPREAARPIPLYLDLTEDALILHDRGGFFAQVLERARGSVKRLGARRIRHGTTWYWDLKPDFRPGDVVEDMTTREMARSFLRRAAAILREAERLLGDKAWNLVVRRCQEAVELALKGALREAGVEVPKVHDVSGALRRNTRRLPPHLVAEIDLLVSASRRLREERGRRSVKRPS